MSKESGLPPKSNVRQTYPVKLSQAFVCRSLHIVLYSLTPVSKLELQVIHYYLSLYFVLEELTQKIESKAMEMKLRVFSGSK